MTTIFPLPIPNIFPILDLPPKYPNERRVVIPSKMYPGFDYLVYEWGDIYTVVSNRNPDHGLIVVEDWCVLARPDYLDEPEVEGALFAYLLEHYEAYIRSAAHRTVNPDYFHVFGASVGHALY